jgi:hypothetical protein
MAIVVFERTVKQCGGSLNNVDAMLLLLVVQLLLLLLLLRLLLYDQCGQV